MGFLIVFLIVIAVLIILLVVSIHMARKNARVKKDRRNYSQGRGQQLGAAATADLFLVSGLPLTENTFCQLFVTDSQLIIEAQAQQFHIDINRMIAAQAKTDVDIQKEVTSSAGKAIAGAVLFGPVGAIVGGRAKTKTTREYSYYLIINYTGQQGATEVLAFTGASKNCQMIANALAQKIQYYRAGTITNL